MTVFDPSAVGPGMPSSSTQSLPADAALRAVKVHRRPKRPYKKMLYDKLSHHINAHTARRDAALLKLEAANSRARALQQKLDYYVTKLSRYQEEKVFREEVPTPEGAVMGA